MSDFITRLEAEHDELEGKMVKLDAFMRSEAFSKITLKQRELLTIQYSIMVAYLNVLLTRIKDLKTESPTS